MAKDWVHIQDTYCFL